jgi:hypothetical protein
LGDGSLARMVFACALACASLTTHAQPQLQCGRDGSGKTWCIDLALVGENGAGLRFAPLYQGNERVAHPTGYVARANCQTRTIEFMQGNRPFWSALFAQSMLADRLGAAMCD